jgi:hypothetical protein
MSDVSHLNLPAEPQQPSAHRGRIPDDFVRSLRERADIVAVVDRRLPLTKRGKDHWSRCPFHEDGSPSFSVNGPKGFYHCFGCGENGDAVAFVMKHDGMSFADAVRQVASEAGITVPNEPAGTRPARRMPKSVRLERLPADREEPVLAPESVVAFMTKAQSRIDDAAAVAYLERRGIPVEVARRFGLGYAPAGFRGLPDGLDEAGEAKVCGFDGPRIVAPHTTPGGELVNVYGRRIDGRDTLKHRNLGFGPAGVFNAQSLQGSGGSVWIAEGVFDAISLAMAGVERPVAIFGLGRMRWGWINPAQRELVLAVDTDAAAGAAAERFLREATMRGHIVSRLTAEEVGGFKDVNEAHVAGVLTVGDSVLTTSTPHEDHGSASSSSWRSLLLGVTDDEREGFSGAQWIGFVAVCRRFALEHAVQAEALGWSLEELASLPTMRTGTDAGALWDVACAGSVEVRLHADRIEMVTPSGSVLVTHRRDLRPSRVLPWSPPWDLGAG